MPYSAIIPQNIITYVLQTILHAIEYDRELKEAVEQQRIYTTNPNSYRYQDGISSDTMSELNALGHKIRHSPTTNSNFQSFLIDRENGMFKGVADSYRNGAAIGVNPKGNRK